MKTTKNALERRTLEIKIRKLQNECTNHVAKLVSQHKELNQCSELGMTLNKSFLEDGKRMYEKLRKVRLITDQFREEAARIKKCPPASVEHLQRMMQQVESLLTQYKADECVMAEVLLRDEVPLWKDCLFMEKRIAGWDGDQEKVERKFSHGAAQKRSLTSDITYDLPKEIADYQRFLDANGGKLGGWTDQEHGTFLRLRQKHKAKKMMKCSYNSEEQILKADTIAVSQTTVQTLANAQSDSSNSGEHTHGDVNGTVCPEASTTTKKLKESEVSDIDISLYREVSAVTGTKSPEEVKQHELWWEKLQVLEVSKRKAIQQWREKRLSTKCPPITEIGQSSAKSSRKTSVPTVDQLEAQKAALDRWREEKKKLAMEASQAEEKAALEIQQARSAQLEKRQNEIKKRLAQYHSTKQAEQVQLAHELATREDEERACRRVQLSRSVDRIRQRNEHLTKEQNSRKQALKMAEKERMARMEKAIERQKAQLELYRDPSRLTQWTQGWRLRMAVEPEAAQTQIGLPCGPVLSGRGIPEWRRGISEIR